MQSRRRFPHGRQLVAAALVAGMLGQWGPAAYADMQDDLNRALEEQRYLEEQRQQTENELARIYAEVEAAQEQLEAVEAELAEATRELDLVSEELATAEAELAQVEAELEDAQNRYTERQQLLGRRMRSLQEQGRVNYLGVLLGSTSFSDFLTRLDSLKAVVKQDARLMADIREEKRQLALKQEEVDNRRVQLVALKERAEARQYEVAMKRDEQAAVSRSLDERKRELEWQLDLYEAESQRIAQEIWLIQQRMNRQNSDGFAPIYPLTSIVITDYFGPRLHPILGTWRNHYGTDFAAGYGDPVYAIEDGVVIMAGWNDAYGNLVVIDHGNGIASWYGHNSELLVSVGDTVLQGDQIARAGSTGWSTGPHVHLEIHVNGEPQDPLSFLP